MIQFSIPATYEAFLFSMLWMYTEELIRRLFGLPRWYLKMVGED